jgi:hypothetical protein
MQDYRQLNNLIRPSDRARRVYGGLARPWLNQAAQQQPPPMREPEPAAVVLPEVAPRGFYQPESGDEDVVEERRCVRAPPLPPNGVRRSDTHLHAADEAFAERVERQIAESRRRGSLDVSLEAESFARRVASALVAHSTPARPRPSPYSAGESLIFLYFLACILFYVYLNPYSAYRF